MPSQIKITIGNIISDTELFETLCVKAVLKAPPFETSPNE